MIYNRGTKDCYAGWANATGDASWGWDSFLPFFTRGSNYSGTESNTFRASNATAPPPEDIAVNATGGPLHLSFPNFALPFFSYAEEAFRELGIPEVRSLIGGELLGSQYNPFTIGPVDPTRYSSQTSFLKASMHVRELA